MLTTLSGTMAISRPAHLVQGEERGVVLPGVGILKKSKTTVKCPNHFVSDSRFRREKPLKLPGWFILLPAAGFEPQGLLAWGFVRDSGPPPVTASTKYYICHPTTWPSALPQVELLYLGKSRVFVAAVGGSPCFLGRRHFPLTPGSREGTLVYQGKHKNATYTLQSWFL